MIHNITCPGPCGGQILGTVETSNPIPPALGMLCPSCAIIYIEEQTPGKIPDRAARRRAMTKSPDLAARITANLELKRRPDALTDLTTPLVKDM